MPSTGRTTFRKSGAFARHTHRLRKRAWVTNHYRSLHARATYHYRGQPPLPRLYTRRPPNRGRSLRRCAGRRDPTRSSACSTALATSAGTSSADSSRSESTAAFVRVAGWRGVKREQQSSSGRIEMGNVPMPSCFVDDLLLVHADERAEYGKRRRRFAPSLGSPAFAIPPGPGSRRSRARLPRAHLRLLRRCAS